MSQPIYLSGREISLDDDSFIVTKTDLRGNIIYANRVFMQITGYRESELLGKPQNIIRHPEMPKGVFRYLWQEIAAGRECFSYVNNRAKSGDNYWVFANISPVFDPNKKMIGYFSCRRKPKAQAVAAAKALYQQMLLIEQQNPGDRGEKSMQWMLTHIQQEHGSYEKFILGL
ncbi:MAG: PAS domain S-box protein [Gammaproteobacteria bacterium]|nr:PAS domain S-box protein [Gammaproteobacteria bacterium]